MNKFGLNEKECEIINDIFESYDQIDEVIIFGSRALGTFKPTSDIDFAIKGKEISKVYGKLKDDFEESSIIFEVDIVIYENINSDKLIENIDNLGVLFYRKGL